MIISIFYSLGLLLFLAGVGFYLTYKTIFSKTFLFLKIFSILLLILLFVSIFFTFKATDMYDGGRGMLLMASCFVGLVILFILKDYKKTK